MTYILPTVHKSIKLPICKVKSALELNFQKKATFFCNFGSLLPFFMEALHLKGKVLKNIDLQIPFKIALFQIFFYLLCDRVGVIYFCSPCTLI